jgi:hypothetical protein
MVHKKGDTRSEYEDKMLQIQGRRCNICAGSLEANCIQTPGCCKVVTHLQKPKATPAQQSDRSLDLEERTVLFFVNQNENFVVWGSEIQLNL